MKKNGRKTRQTKRATGNAACDSKSDIRSLGSASSGGRVGRSEQIRADRAIRTRGTDCEAGANVSGKIISQLISDLDQQIALIQDRRSQLATLLDAIEAGDHNSENQADLPAKLDP